MVLSQQETKRKIGEGVGPAAWEVMLERGWKKLAHPLRNQTKGQIEEQQHESHVVEDDVILT